MLTACNSEIYVRDGVTDGDTFYLAERALTDDGPVLQSWVRYSLTKSTCQLQIGGENPARASSLECELSSRRMLLDAWNERKHETPDIEDSYLDELVEVQRLFSVREEAAAYALLLVLLLVFSTDCRTQHLVAHIAASTIL